LQRLTEESGGGGPENHLQIFGNFGDYGNVHEFYFQKINAQAFDTPVCHCYSRRSLASAKKQRFVKIRPLVSSFCLKQKPNHASQTRNHEFRLPIRSFIPVSEDVLQGSIEQEC